MVKIVRAHELPGRVEDNISPSLNVKIEVEGYLWTLGGLPVEWGLDEVKKYIEKNYNDILRQAKLKAPKEIYPKQRPDLLMKFTPAIKEVNEIA